MPAIGNATNSPVNPQRVPPANKANITQRGCSPILLPTSFGVIKLPSNICPATKIAMVIIM